MTECMKKECPMVKNLKFLVEDSVAGQGDGQDCLADMTGLLESGFGIEVSVDQDKCKEMMRKTEENLGSYEEQLEICKKLSGDSG